MRILIPQLVFFILFWIFFKGFQNEKIYTKTLAKISVNYEKTANGIIDTNKPFQSINDSNIAYFDASWYNLIHLHGYRHDDKSIFGFYPLFPALWRVTLIPPRLVPFLNFTFFVLGLLLISRCYRVITQSRFEWLLATFPGFISFIIPYSESLFFLCIAIALYGYTKSNYKILFAGLFLASLTRAVSLIFFGAIFAAEFVWWLSDRNLRERMKSLMKHILPILSATIVVSVVQYLYGSNSFFMFIHAHKNWQQSFSVPAPMSDWSFEGFGMNLSSFFMVGAPAIGLSFASVFEKQITREKFFPLLSAIFLAGSTFFVYYFQNGSLHSFFRYLICSPFFFILLFAIDIKSISVAKRAFIFSIITLNALFMFTLSGYSAGIQFADLGFLLVLLAVGLWVFNDFSSTIIYKIILILVILANVVWSTYLMNFYISGTWLFL
jgi:hypothetical protein